MTNYHCINTCVIAGIGAIPVWIWHIMAVLQDYFILQFSNKWMKLKLYFHDVAIYNNTIIYIPKTERRHDVNFVVTGGTGGCHNDNLRCNSNGKVGITATLIFSVIPWQIVLLENDKKPILRLFRMWPTLSSRRASCRAFCAAHSPWWLNSVRVHRNRHRSQMSHGTDKKANTWFPTW